MQTTIKISKETKDRLDASTYAGKGKTYDMIVNELLTYNERNEKSWKKKYEQWKKRNTKYQASLKDHDKRAHEYTEGQATYKKLLAWARSQGFTD